MTFNVRKTLAGSATITRADGGGSVGLLAKLAPYEYCRS